MNKHIADLEDSLDEVFDVSEIEHDLSIETALRIGIMFEWKILELKAVLGEHYDENKILNFIEAKVIKEFEMLLVKASEGDTKPWS